MSHDLPLPPDYPFNTVHTGDRDILSKVFEYSDAVSARNVALEKAGWHGEGAYFAGHIEATFKRRANKIYIDPQEVVSKLEIDDGEGALLPGYAVGIDKGHLTVGYTGATDGAYFATMDHFIDWSQELSEREENASKRGRFVQLLRQANVLR